MGAVTELSCGSECDLVDDQTDVLEGEGIEPVEGVEMVSVRATASLVMICFPVAVRAS